MERIGNRITKARKKLNLNQKELADKCGITEATLSRYENGLREPKSEIVVKMADVLNVTTDYLLGRNDNQQMEKGLPIEFKNPSDALEFILKQKTLMSFGGYDASKLSDKELLDFANDLLEHVKLLSYKYNK